MDPDRSVQQTNDEAAAAKLAAAARGYFRDPFLEAMMRGTTPERRSPLINRGTFARVVAMRLVTEQFLDATQGSHQGRQIIALGSGFDTAFWNLDRSRGWDDSRDCYVEFDFTTVCKDKARRVRASSLLCKPLVGLKEHVEREDDGIVLESQSYVLCGVDLRQTEQLVDRIKAIAGLLPDRPLLVLAEVVLVYLEPRCSDAIIGALTRHFNHLTWAIYEMILAPGADAFGHQMVRNIAARGCPLLGLGKYPTLKDQQTRFAETFGYAEVRAVDMQRIYERVLAESATRAARGVEMLDEVEEWNLLMSHYMLLLAFNIAEASEGFPLLAKEVDSCC